MNLKLLEKFVLEITPPDAKIPLHRAFLGLKDQPMKVMVEALNLIKIATAIPDAAVAVASVNGVILGIALCRNLEVQPGFDQVIKEFCEHNARGRGEHVVDFLSHRITKGK